MRTTFKFLIICLALPLLGLELRLAAGQHYHEDASFTTSATHFFLESGFALTGFCSIGGGLRYINFGEVRTDLSGILIGTIDGVPSGARADDLIRHINGVGAYAMAKVQPKLGDEAKLAPYVTAASGFQLVYPTIEIEYRDGTSKYSFEDDQPSEAIPFAMLTGGFEVIFGKLGVFAQVSYVKSGLLEYGAYEPVDGLRLAPGGSVDPSGWQIFAGVALH